MPKRSIRHLAAAALLALPLGAAAQGYPNKPVRFIVPFAAGGATDISARIVGQKLGEIWGHTIVVDNKGGAAGNIAGAEVAKSPPDGYTLFFTSGSVVTANEHIYPNMPFNPAKDFVAVTNVVRGAQVVVVPANSPYKTLKELIDAARVKPGGLNYGHAGIGSQTHLAAENFLYAAKSEVQNVPY
jgi:tripartite-type tricarboxylate transporter receptor subunit TctC